MSFQALLSGRTRMLKQAIRTVVNKIGYTIERKNGPRTDPIIPFGIVEDEFEEMYRRCRPFTMTTALEMYNLWNAVRYVAQRNLRGDFVECGVWRGGSAMVMALSLLQVKDRERRLFLYDTYEGMPSSTKEDVTHRNEAADVIRERLHTNDGWLYASVEEVRANLLSTGFPEAQIIFVKGKVEQTIPETIPERIAILRLDTDFYESTFHELNHLFPRLQKNGILIVDDYDYWRGSRRAADQYFEKYGIQMFLQRMDVGRIGIKV